MMQPYFLAQIGEGSGASEKARADPGNIGRRWPEASAKRLAPATTSQRTGKNRPSGKLKLGWKAKS